MFILTPQDVLKVLKLVRFKICCQHLHFGRLHMLKIQISVFSKVRRSGNTGSAFTLGNSFCEEQHPLVDRACILSFTTVPTSLYCIVPNPFPWLSSPPCPTLACEFATHDVKRLYNVNKFDLRKCQCAISFSHLKNICLLCIRLRTSIPETWLATEMGFCCVHLKLLLSR